MILFKPEDLKNPCIKHHSVDSAIALACDMVNHKLNAEIHKWPVVYGSSKRPLDGWNEKSYPSTTHQGRLAFIEQIWCEHVPQVVFVEKLLPEKTFSAVCSKCGTKLKATWSEA